MEAVTLRIIATILFTLCLSATPAQSDSWDKTIAAVDAKSDALWKKSRSMGFQDWLGTALNELHAVEHKCSILGRMLGNKESIEALERSTEMDHNSPDPREIAIAAHSLSTWVYQATRMKALDRDRRVREWNLDCVGNFGIPSKAYIAETADTFYDVDGDVLRVFGDVEEGYADKLISAHRANPHVTTIALGSAGGLVSEAIRAGMYIRNAGLETMLWNNCYSACTIVFVGGTRRSVMSPYPDLGFHQISSKGVAVPLGDKSYRDVWAYVSIMGVNAAAFVSLMHSAPPSSFIYPEGDELCETKIATWVQRVCLE